MARVAASFGQVHLAIQRGESVSDAVWNEWLASLQQDPDGRLRLLVESHGGGPNAKQRKQFVDAMRGRDLRIAVLTDSPISRGMVTAVSWLGQPLRSFRVAQLAEAIAWLDLTPSEGEQLRVELAKLRRQMPRAAAAGR